MGVATIREFHTVYDKIGNISEAQIKIIEHIERLITRVKALEEKNDANVD